jgi:hypothetical protein
MSSIKRAPGPQGQYRNFQLRNLLTVYLDGELVGSVDEGGGSCLARDADGKFIGTYAGRPAAMAAIEAAQP